MIEGTFRKHADQWVASFALADPDTIGEAPAVPVSGDRAVLVRQNGDRREVIVGECVVADHYGHALHQFEDVKT